MQKKKYVFEDIIFNDTRQEIVAIEQCNSSHSPADGAAVRTSVIFCSKTIASIVDNKAETILGEDKQASDVSAVKNVDIAKKVLFFKETEPNASNTSVAKLQQNAGINESISNKISEMLKVTKRTPAIMDCRFEITEEPVNLAEAYDKHAKTVANNLLKLCCNFDSNKTRTLENCTSPSTSESHDLSYTADPKSSGLYCSERIRYCRKRPQEKSKSAGSSPTKKPCFDNFAGDVLNLRLSESYSGAPAITSSPADLNQWLDTYDSWSSVERNHALDSLISRSTVLQVRHMMKTIEPLFQTDFISLLPKELALIVLVYLEPEDLSKVAQTCRYWRFLANDNLLWKKLCHRSNITTVCPYFRQTVSSPWKWAYTNQYKIERNWRTKPASEAIIMRGHDDHVITCLQCHGNRIVSGSDDTTLKVWSTVTGECLQTLVGHAGGVWSCQMVGDLVVSGSTDRTLRVWDAVTGICLNVLGGHTSTVRCMRLYQDKVVSGSRDATLRVWSIPEGCCLRVLIGHVAAVRCVQYDGNLVVSGAYDFSVKIWNPDTGECLHTLSGHTNRVYTLKFDSVHVVSGSLDTSIRVWDAATGQLKHTLTGHTSLITSMELQSNILISGNADSTLKVWDITTGQCLHTLAGNNKHQLSVTYVQLLKRFVVSSSDDGTVKLWDLKTGEFIRNIVELPSGGSGGNVLRIRASNTQLVCAVGSRNGTEETKLMLMKFNQQHPCHKCKCRFSHLVNPKKGTQLEL